MNIETIFHSITKELQLHFPHVVLEAERILSQENQNPLVAHFLDGNDFSYVIGSPLDSIALSDSKHFLFEYALNARECIDEFCSEPWVEVSGMYVKPLQDAIVRYIRSVHSLSDEQFEIRGISQKPFRECDSQFYLSGVLDGEKREVCLKNRDNFGDLGRYVQNLQSKSGLMHMFSLRHLFELDVNLVQIDERKWSGTVSYENSDGVLLRQRDISVEDKSFGFDYLIKSKLYHEFMQPALSEFNRKKGEMFEKLTPVAGAHLVAQMMLDYTGHKKEVEAKRELLKTAIKSHG